MENAGRIHMIAVVVFLWLMINVSPAISASPELTDIEAVIEWHYFSRAAENLAGHLDTIFFTDGPARVRGERALSALWRRVRLEQPRVMFIAARESASGKMGAVHFTVDYLLTLTETGARFPKQDENIALLEKHDGDWRIRRVMSVDALDYVPQALDDAGISAWQEDMKSIRNLLAVYSASARQGRAAVEDIRQGLLLAYDFTKEPQEKAFKDLSGNGYTALLEGPLWAGNNGLYFDGRDDFVRVKGGEKVHFDMALTVIGEILPASFAHHTWQSIVWKGDPASPAVDADNPEFGIWLHNQAFLRGASTARDGLGKGQTYCHTRAGSVTRKRVFALVINSVKGTMTAFLDGDAAASNNYSTAGIRETGGGLLIGGGIPFGDGAHFRGYIRWLRIYSRALSEGEIDRLCACFSVHEAPWDDPYQVSDVNLPDDGAGFTPIHLHSAFTPAGLKSLEPGVAIRHGWITLPGRNRPTEIIYRHDGSYLWFSGLATILDCLDYCGQGGLVEQKIIGDGAVLWESGRIAQREPGKGFSVDLAGVKEVRLVTTDGGNGVGEDWAAWLNLKLSTVSENSIGVDAKPTALPAVVRRTETASRAKAKIDHIYTLAEKPSGSTVVNVDRFRLSAEQVYVWFAFSGMTTGTIIKGIWRDEGRRTILQEFPIVITRESGNAGFALRQPLHGWTPGNYRIDLMSGADLLGGAGFQITK